MAIVNFPSQQIVPRTPKTAMYYSGTNTQNTWYTLLSVTAGTGVLNRIVLTSDLATNNYMEIRITVDGVASTLSSTSTLMYSRAFVFNNSAGSPGSYNSPYAYYYNSPIYFFTSLTVEIRHTYSFTSIFDAVCDYSLI